MIVPDVTTMNMAPGGIEPVMSVKRNVEGSVSQFLVLTEYLQERQARASYDARA
jgi:hypothetical protein